MSESLLSNESFISALTKTALLRFGRGSSMLVASGRLAVRLRVIGGDADRGWRARLLSLLMSVRGDELRVLGSDVGMALVGIGFALMLRV